MFIRKLISTTGLGTILLVTSLSASIEASALVVRRLTIPNTGISGNVIVESWGDRNWGFFNTYHITASNSSSETYECTGSIRFRDTSTYQLTAFGVTDTETIEPYAQDIIVVKTETAQTGTGYYHDQAGSDDTLSCRVKDSGGGTGGGGDSGAGDAVSMSSVGVQFAGSSATISVGSIINRSTSSIGPLFLTLRATKGTDPGGNGYTLGKTDTFGSLNSSYQLTNLSRTVNISPPPAGTYYIHVVLQENATKYIVARTMSSTKTFSDGSSGAGTGNGGTSGGGSGGGGANNQSLDISGGATVSWADGRATMTVGRITNHSSTRTTGNLYVTLVATSNPSPLSNGYKVAKFSLWPLSPGQTLAGDTFTADFTPPPAGTYYMHLVLSEAPNDNTMLDYYTFSSTQSFSDSSQWSEESDGGGGGGGGGGSLDAGLLLALLFARRAALRIRELRRAA